MSLKLSTPYFAPQCAGGWENQQLGGKFERISDKKKGQQKEAVREKRRVERARMVCVRVSARQRARGDYLVLI